MKTIKELLDLCYQENIQSVTREELAMIECGHDFLKLRKRNDDEDFTEKALGLLAEIAQTHERQHTDLEKKLIETGVLSGNCYICWHFNKYYPEATVDRLREVGFEAFYNEFKGNWERIKSYRKSLYADDGRHSDAGDRI